MVAATILRGEATFLIVEDGVGLTVADREVKVDVVILGAKAAPGEELLGVEVRLKLLMLELIFGSLAEVLFRNEQGRDVEPLPSRVGAESGWFETR